MSINTTLSCWKNIEEEKLNEIEGIECCICFASLSSHSALIHRGTNEIATYVHAFCLERWAQAHTPISCPICRQEQPSGIWNPQFWGYLPDSDLSDDEYRADGSDTDDESKNASDSESDHPAYSPQPSPTSRGYRGPTESEAESDYYSSANNQFFSDENRGGWPFFNREYPSSN